MILVFINAFAISSFNLIVFLRIVFDVEFVYRYFDFYFTFHKIRFNFFHFQPIIVLIIIYEKCLQKKVEKEKVSL